MSSVSLPDEVLEKILLGVAAFDDLVRCKGVCKGWRSLISSADFVAAHLRRAKSDPSSHHLLVRDSMNALGRRKKAVPVAVPLPSFICFSSSDLLIVGSVNGLICIAGKGDAPPSPSPDDIWIWNPVTGLSKKLPNSSRVFGDCSVHNVKFAFWCDDESDDLGVYKVAKIFIDRSSESTLELWVSTSPDTWTVISNVELDFELHSRLGVRECDVLIEGLAAYWIVELSNYDKYNGSDAESDYEEVDDESRDEVEEEDDDESMDEVEEVDDESRDEVVVVSLDLKTLALTKFVPLTKGQLDLRACYLSKLEGAGYDEPLLLFGGSLNGEFALVADSLFDRYDVWTHDTGAAIWIKNFTIRFDSFTYEKCLGIVNDKILLVQYDDAEVASYDLLTGMLEVLETDSKLYDVTLESAFGFVGSLVSIDGFGVEHNDLFRKYMAISWPRSLYHHNLQEGGSEKKPEKKKILIKRENSLEW